MKRVLNTPYLLVGFLTYVLFVLVCLGFETDLFAINSIAYFLAISSFLFVFIGFNNSIDSFIVIDVIELLFKKLTIYGGGVVALNLVALFVGYFLSNKFGEFIYYIAYFFTVSYFFYAFVSYRKLVLVRRTKWLENLWQTFSVVIIVAICAIIFKRFDNSFSILIQGGILFIGTICIILILPNNKWIAFIDKQAKVLSIFYLLVLILLSLLLALLVLNFKIQLNILRDLLVNEFVFLIVGFFVSYNLFALLTLLFNWPLFNALERQLLSVKSFQEVNREIIEQRNFNALYAWFLEACSSATTANFGWIINTKNNEIVHSKNIDKIDTDEFINNLSISENKSFQYYNDLRFLKDKNSAGSALVIKVEDKRNNSVLLFLGRQITGGFDRYMIDLCKSYAEQVELILESINLFDKNIQNERIESELRIAQRVQKALIPKYFPESNYFDLYAVSESAYEVGGDYFDFIELDDYRLATIVADVSGSGTSAAFYMAELKGIFQSLIQLNLPADMFMEFCNEALGNCLERSVFITLTYCLFDFGQNKLTYGRAGHTPVLYYSLDDKSAHFLKDEGMGLGIIRNRSYSKFINIYERKLNAGDIYVMFTDGLSEAKNDEGVEFGEERLRFILDECHNLDANGIVENIIGEYERFSKQVEADDRSVLAIKVK